MANTSSAKKAIRVSGRKAVHNALRKNKIANSLAAVKKMIASSATREDKAKAMSKLQQALDKAVKAKTYDKNKAARVKSRMSASLKKAAK